MVVANSGPGPWPDLPYAAVNRWYQAPVQGVSTTLLTVLNQCYLIPWFPGWEFILNAVAVNVSVLGIGSTLRAGLVYADGGTGLPTTLAADWGTISAGTAGAKNWTGMSYDTVQRPYFFAIGVTGVACTLSARTGINPMVASPSISFADANAYVLPGVTGALPTDFTGATTVSVAPTVAFQMT